MCNKNEIILPDDPRSAELVTVTLWRSRTGRLYSDGDEGIARWDGATHIYCDKCGKPTQKGTYIICQECREKRKIKKWNAMPKQSWDGVAPICIMDEDKFFFSEDELEDYCIENDICSTDLLLVHCKARKLPQLDVYDYLADYLPEDSDDCLPDDILDAEQKLNEAIEKCQPFVYEQGCIAVDL